MKNNKVYILPFYLLICTFLQSCVAYHSPVKMNREGPVFLTAEEKAGEFSYFYSMQISYDGHLKSADFDAVLLKAAEGQASKLCGKQSVRDFQSEYESLITIQRGIIPKKKYYPFARLIKVNLECDESYL